MAQELAQNGQDLALKALVGGAILARKTWVVPCTSVPSADRVVTATEVYTARFQGADPIETDNTDWDWATPTGTSPNARVADNLNALATAAAAALGAPIDVTHFAVVQTDDDLVPDDADTYSNVDVVIGQGALDSTKSGVDNGDVISFAAGSITVSVD